MMEEERPEYVTDELLEYLDELRASGAVNMFGAGTYLRKEFALSRNESSIALGYWFSERVSKMAAYAPGPMEGDKEGCRSIVKQAKIATAIALTTLAVLLIGACQPPCDPSTQPCDVDLSTRNQVEFNPPPDMHFCVYGAELVPCDEE